MSYTAVKLDDGSRKRLLEALGSLIPASWEVRGDHVTIHLGKPLRDDKVGEAVNLKATAIGYSTGAVAAKVEGIEVASENPHCTLGYNAKEGYRPKDAKTITTWIDLPVEIPITGRIVYIDRNRVIAESRTTEKDHTQIMRISFYDFDRSIMDGPTPEIGREIWRRKTGEDFPHLGWWSKKESLDHTIFPFTPIREVADRIKRDYEDPSCWTMVLSNRVESLLPYMKSLMDQYDIKVDDFLLRRPDNLPKPVRIKRMLPKFPQATSIDIHEDDPNNLELFRELKQEIGPRGYLVSIFQVLPPGSPNRRIRID